MLVRVIQKGACQMRAEENSTGSFKKTWRKTYVRAKDLKTSGMAM